MSADLHPGVNLTEIWTARLLNQKNVTMAHHEELLKKLSECASACEWCHDACLGEENVKMLADCIRLDRDCAKICLLTSGLVASHSPWASRMVKLCEEICTECAEECENHDMDHCRNCAGACRACAGACRDFQED
jgi:hypothetical protein